MRFDCELPGLSAHAGAPTRIRACVGAFLWCLLYVAWAGLCHAQDTSRDISMETAERDRIKMFHTELGIASDYAAQTGLPLQLPPRQLKDIGEDMFGRSQQLESRTADAWVAMVEAASRDGVSLLLVSAFRPPQYQRVLLHRKLPAGETIRQALAVVAAPGYSEHQSGRAVDVGCPACPILETRFEDTEAFQWLVGNAAAYGFFLSYSRDNPHGIIYEPWHWYYKGN